jgi:hypothetical protein
MCHFYPHNLGCDIKVFDVSLIAVHWIIVTAIVCVKPILSTLNHCDQCSITSWQVNGDNGTIFSIEKYYFPPYKIDLLKIKTAPKVTVMSIVLIHGRISVLHITENHRQMWPELQSRKYQNPWSCHHPNGQSLS